VSSQPSNHATEGSDPPRRKTRAIATIVHDEAVFFPIWLDYYSQFFAPEDIYVLDHETSDGSTSGSGFHRLPVTHDSVDHVWMVETVQALQHELLERYDVVLVTDVDEIVAADPDWGTLGDYIDQFDVPFVCTQGYELVHMKGQEPPLDWDSPILGQRRHWFRNYAYDKPILATEPLVWFPGFHALRSGAFHYDDRLFLIHLHRMDFDACIERHRTRRRMAWNKKDLDGAWAAHNRLVDDAELERWFYNDTGIPEWPVTVEGIPERWVKLILHPRPHPQQAR
jgi:hypothetical protein